MVISARGDKTDELIDLAKQISTLPPPREMDMLLSTGERISMSLLSLALSDLGLDSLLVSGMMDGRTARQV